MAQQQSRAQPTVAQRALASSVGSVITALVTTPLDVVKTRLQAAPASSPAVVAITHSSSSSGSISSRRGPSQMLARQASGWARLAGHRCLTCGSVMLRGSHVCLGAEEFKGEQAKNRRAVAAAASRQGPPPSTVRALLQIGRAEGLPGLYAGLSPTLVMTVPQTVLYFTCYEGFKARLEAAGAGNLTAPMAAGGSARVLAVVALAPLELIRTRMQGAAAAPGPSPTLRSALRDAVASGGARSLFTGLVPTLWRDVPFSVLYWAGFESIRRTLATGGAGDGAAGSAWWRQPAEGSTLVAHSFVAGIGAGAFATMATHPFDVVKTRQQLSATGERMWPLARRIVQQEGASALLAGLPARVAKVAPACAIMISSYEATKQLVAGSNGSASAW